MKPIAYPKMFFSYHDGWDAFREAAPAVFRTLFLLVLPFSLIPAAMLAYVAPQRAAQFNFVTSATHLEQVAGLFLLTELLTVPLMAFAIRSIVTRRGHKAGFRHCFLLAALAAIPMWLSSLAMFLPSMTLIIGCNLAGLGGACLLLMHGIPSLLGVDEGVEAQEISMVVMTLGALVWALLVALVIAPLLAT
jgi:hypothetical protein